MPFFNRNQKPLKTPSKSLLGRQANNQKLFDSNTLLPVEKIIALAKKNGVNMGRGNVKERIRYFIKLGILPHAVRKSTVKVARQSNGSLDSTLSTLTSH